MHPLILCSLISISVALVARSAVNSPTILVSTGSVWKYYDSGIPLAAGWQNTNFDDGDWLSGPAQLGYGDGDEQTAIASAPNKPITVYFRHTFINTNAGFFQTLTLGLLRDDGAIVYLNNREVFRSNLPDDPVSAYSYAVSENETEENRYFQAGVSTYFLVQGPNTVAVEVHQAGGFTEDCSFDLQLIANLPLTPPTVELISPVDGAIFSSGNLLLAATASDLDGHVNAVEFFAGPRLLGIAYSEPFNFIWANPAPGHYSLRAHAVDNSGRSGDSALSHVQIGQVEAAVLTRGPYLQLGTPTNVIVRWRTDWFVDSRVIYGTNPARLDLTNLDPNPAIDHQIQLAGLSPDTTYYYAVGSGTELMAGGPDYSFVTAPASNKAVRVWAIGDSGTAGVAARAVRDAFRDYTAVRRADLWLMLGDNAYDGGTDDEYQAAVFETYPEMLRRAVLWPTIGNHDATYADPIGRIPYHEIFTLPTQGEAGGLASGTENYYSFDYGNIHFVCLDSSLSDRSPNGAMLNWLKSDLAATAQDWIIAFWHHPPYSFGTHNSDYDPDMIEMRQNAGPILEDYGADLVLSGHSHDYERTYLLSGHYGNSTTLTPSMILDPAPGRADGTGPYVKPAGGLGAGLGTVYIVCGCSGEGGLSTVARHPAMAFNLGGYGSLVLDIDGLTLNVRFLRDTGGIDDYFTINKGTGMPHVRPSLEISRAGHNARLSWPTSLDPYVLETTAGIGPAFGWHITPVIPTPVGRNNSVTLEIEGPHRLFRLRLLE